MAKKTREPGRFVTLRSGRVIFIPAGKRSKWADVRDKVLAGKGRARVAPPVTDPERVTWVEGPGRTIKGKFSLWAATIGPSAGGRYEVRIHDRFDVLDFRHRIIADTVRSGKEQALAWASKRYKQLQRDRAKAEAAGLKWRGEPVG